MNKYIIIIVILALIIGGGAFYRAKFVPDIEKAIVTGVERELTIIVHENTWKFIPEEIEIDQGDKIILTIVNRDEYDHGFAIDAYGISQRMPSLQTIVVDFVATRPGDFPYYCSVSCGSGEVNGEKRGHFDQIGKLHVRSLISETSGFGSTQTSEDFVKEARQSSFIASANREVEERGLDIESLSVLFDEDNTLWNIFKNTGDFEMNLPTGSFQTVLYRDDTSKPILWVINIKP